MENLDGSKTHLFPSSFSTNGYLVRADTLPIASGTLKGKSFCNSHTENRYGRAAPPKRPASDLVLEPFNHIQNRQLILSAKVKVNLKPAVGNYKGRVRVTIVAGGSQLRNTKSALSRHPRPFNEGQKFGIYLRMYASKDRNLLDFCFVAPGASGG